MEKMSLVLATSEKTSQIFVRTDILDFMARDLKERPLGNRLGMVTDSRVETIVGKRLQDRLAKSGLPLNVFAFRPGERSKRWKTLRSIFEWMADSRFDRKSALLALGGGVVGDVTGFAASLYMRSIPYAQIPTTFLAQVDSSLGGKTAIDLPERKNLLGTFHQPERVYVDPSFLCTLPRREVRNGLVEAIKLAVVKDCMLFQLLEDRRNAILSGDPEIMETVIIRCCRMKSAVVMQDEKDRGLRRILNFGHTVAHAIEAYTRYRVPHGRAVAMGISAETALSSRLNMLTMDERGRILHLLERYGLPTMISPSYDRKRLVHLMRSDKKAENGKITVVLPTAIGRVKVENGIPPSLMESVLKEVSG